MKKSSLSGWRYKIFLAPFPFGDLKTKKYRPVLSLTEPQGEHEELTLAYITTNIEGNRLKSDVLIKKSDKDFERSGLKANSLIKINKLLTLPKKMIVGQLGSLSVKKSQEVKNKIKELFSL